MAVPAPISIGQQFRLQDAVVAISRQTDREVAVYLPPGAEITVIDPICDDPPSIPNQRATIAWDGRRFSMFVVDILEKCELF